jgi:myo-inositol-1(or 4)-monophosphatase
MKDIIGVGIEAAKEAGALLADNFGKISRVESKGNRDLVTNLDKEAEKLIVNKIKGKFPGHGIIAEEGGKENTGNDYVWIIDPLDGTHNYIRNLRLFAVSIGIVHKQVFVGGIIYAPLDEELYVAEKGSGAYKNNVRLSVSSRSDLKDCSLGFDSSIRNSPDIMLAALKDIASCAFNIRMFGSSAIALGYIAEGNIDGTVEFFDKPWDFAAGVCIVEEAGGRFSTLEGKPVSPDTTGYIASNGLIHDKIKNIVVSYL